MQAKLDVSVPMQVFVDEYDCIGCKNCTNVCPKTFEIEDDYGRARAMRQGVTRLLCALCILSPVPFATQLDA